MERASGYEMPTIHMLHRYAKRHGGAVMYAHTKGAGNLKDGCQGRPGQVLDGSTPQDAWRRAMIDRLVLGWRECLTRLEEGYDAVGPMWIHQDFVPNVGQLFSHFSGNFWMATCSYVRRLPRCKTDPSEAVALDGKRYLAVEARAHAEIWIGLGDPRACEAPARLRLEPFDGRDPRSGRWQRYYRVLGFTCPTCKAGQGEPHYAPLVADGAGELCCYAPQLSPRMRWQWCGGGCRARDCIDHELRALVAGEGPAE